MLNIYGPLIAIAFTMKYKHRTWFLERNLDVPYSSKKVMKFLKARVKNMLQHYIKNLVVIAITAEEPMPFWSKSLEVLVFQFLTLVTECS